MQGNFRVFEELFFLWIPDSLFYVAYLVGKSHDFCGAIVSEKHRFQHVFRLL